MENINRMNKKHELRLLSILLALVLFVLGAVGCMIPTVEPAKSNESEVVTFELLTDAPQETTGKETATAQPVTEAQTVTETPAETTTEEAELTVSEDGEYTSKEEVALYLHLYGHLPGNFITKNKAKKLGWVSSEGNLGKVAPGKSIGGDYFGNYEGSLPEKKGRDYYECDIDSTGGYRGAKRIIYSNDGLIYYTEDHYDTFELLYGEED